jgi:hypothetical protein
VSTQAFISRLSPLTDLLPLLHFVFEHCGKDRAPGSQHRLVRLVLLPRYRQRHVGKLLRLEQRSQVLRQTTLRYLSHLTKPHLYYEGVLSHTTPTADWGGGSTDARLVLVLGFGLVQFHKPSRTLAKFRKPAKTPAKFRKPAKTPAKFRKPAKTPAKFRQPAKTPAKFRQPAKTPAKFRKPAKTPAKFRKPAKTPAKFRKPAKTPAKFRESQVLQRLANLAKFATSAKILAKFATSAKPLATFP